MQADDRGIGSRRELASTADGEEHTDMRTRFSTALTVALVWLVMAADWTAATEAFTLRFGASGGLDIPLDGAAEAVVQLGQGADALPGEDSHDVLAPPPPPGGGVPLFYIAAMEPLIGQYWHDFRPPASSQAWELNLVGMNTGVSVTLRWRLEDGGTLGGQPLRLIDRKSRMVLVPDMTTTTQYTCDDADRVLLVAYGDTNRPPLAGYDEVSMLESEDSVSIPFDAVLANDYDPEGGSLEVVRVGSPALSASDTPESGSSDYGTTTLDPVARRISYALPAALPPDWTGRVAFEYAVQDQGPPSPAESTAVILLSVARHVTQTPAKKRVETQVGQPFELAYTIRHTDAIQSLIVEYTLPLIGSGAALGFWQFAGDYSDDAGSAPVIDPGYGSDGIPQTGDDTGVVRLDFGTNVPPSGMRLVFGVLCPVGAAGQTTIRALARYRLDGAKTADYCQTLDEVSVAARYTPEFVAAAGGTVTVEASDSATTATARPDGGYHFAQWTRDGVLYSTVNPLILTDLTSALTLTACFEVSVPVPPSGDFLAVVSATEVASGRGLWNLTGLYSTTAKSHPLTLSLVQDPSGRLSGTATYTVAPETPIAMPIKGSVKGGRGSITMKGSLKGANLTKLVSVSLTLNLTVDAANRQLVGRLTGTIRENGAPTLVNDDLTLAIPGDMDGTWTLRFDLDRTGRTVTGAATLTLSNDAQHAFVASGKTGANNSAVLTLSASPSDPAAKAITIKATITPLEGGWARLESFSGRGYGQALRW